jgi:uncharacterized membrane protein YqjE
MSLLGSLDPTAPRPRVPPLSEAATLLNDALSHRADLAAIELAEARAHAQASLLLLGLAALLALLGGFALTLTLTGLVWDSPHRVAWLTAMCVAYLLGAVATGFLLHRRMQAWRPFSEICHQLQQDQQCLTRLIRSILP